MKKFLILSAAILFAATVNAQLYLEPSGKLTFGGISSVADCVTAWEGSGHYFHNGASESGATWLKLDLTAKNPCLWSNDGTFTFDNTASNPRFTIDLSKSSPRIYSRRGSIYFKGTNYQDLYAGGVHTVADSRVQTNSVRLQGALDLVGRMIPRNFQPTQVALRRRYFYGFLGQELESVVPNLVTQDEEGVKYVNYVELVPILTGAIQELTVKLHEQEQRIAQLEDMLNNKIKP